MVGVLLYHPTILPPQFLSQIPLSDFLCGSLVFLFTFSISCFDFRSRFGELEVKKYDIFRKYVCIIEKYRTFWFKTLQSMNENQNTK